MVKDKQQVRFAVSYTDEDQRFARSRLTSERAVDTSRLGIWLGLATMLWLLIALAAFI
ncbi:hypothetical protein [Sphingomonas mucosissima]|uniref:Uncharacterized protein n=1 Tax=Sphingomonas mucosissima TaxID=370959 RepID=A0A245ZQB2_9SPHN|nr:hypothetical protein [Sphingomonas mucosissima]OWK31932.1 hypothetical protein SPMU_02520 [Sphingomonas mucosissima]